jgi:hypothetical protein
MNGRINNFMKDCVWVRAALYFFIASIPSLMMDLKQFKSFSDISDISLTLIVCNFLLQGFIAVRAFMDQSISRIQKEKKEKKMEIINEMNN